MENKNKANGKIGGVIDRKKEREEEEKKERISSWVPKTALGKAVKAGKIKNTDDIFGKGVKILEAEIVDSLINLDSDLVEIGQSKGKFGGGKRRAWKQIQRKTAEGNVPSFATLAVVGNREGYVGIGYAKAKETLPARDKAVRKAKLNIIKIKRGCGSFDCACDEEHSILAEVEGKEGSARIKLIPAPKGTGLCVEDECKKILQLAGVQDVYSKTFGKTKTKLNLARACFKALQKTTEFV